MFNVYRYLCCFVNFSYLSSIIPGICIQNCNQHLTGRRKLLSSCIMSAEPRLTATDSAQCECGFRLAVFLIIRSDRVLFAAVRRNM